MGCGLPAKVRGRPFEVVGSWLHNHPQSLHVGFFLVGILVVLALWLVPKFQAARSQGLTVGNRFDNENEARKTLAQIILVLAGRYSLLQTFSLQQKTFDLQRARQITDRLTKAIDQLGTVETGSDGKPKVNLEVRLSGYALERTAHDSPTDHWTIMEVFSTYVRENSRGSEHPGKIVADKRSRGPAPSPPVAAEPHLSTDVQAILTVIGRRDIDPLEGQLILSRTDLAQADLTNARLMGANLNESVLSQATVNHVDLS